MLNPNLYLALMLIAFGSAWPVSIYKTCKAKTNHGKSIMFLYIILVGYVCGVAHQYLCLPDGKYVFYLFAINTLMVIADIGLYYRNHLLYHKKSVVNRHEIPVK